jgi:hypothetical protein
MRTIRTVHFRVHYPVALDSLAHRAALVAEGAYAQLSTELAPPAGPVELLLTDNIDASNGYAQTFPTNRVVIYAVPPISAEELRFHDDWLRLVITHEMAHIFHIDRARGIWRLGRALFGRNPLLFPNQYAPSWVKEGLAVHYESQFTGSGRIVGTEFPLLLRAAARDSALVRMGRWSAATTRFPRGQTVYGYGSMVMERAADRAVAQDSGKSMRRFVDVSAAYLNPFLLSRSAKAGLGATFNETWRGLRDSLDALPIDTSGDARWTLLPGTGWYASSPRWLGRDSLVWSASTGREVAGVYIADVRAGARGGASGAYCCGDPQRIARRNALDANVPAGANAGEDTRLIFAQVERRDPYVSRSDLYAGTSDDEVRLTHGARLTQPDVRADGAIVAVQLGAATTRLVRVSRDGRTILPLTRSRNGEEWAEPRWSPNGAYVAAVQLLRSGEQRVVVLDTLGTLRVAVSGARGVFASPSFTPDGARLVWTSDRSGRMQLETAPIDVATVDTLRWREERADVRQASAVSTGVYEASVSPDGRRVVALVVRSTGFHVALSPLDTTGPMARSMWYPRVNTVPAPVVADSAQILAAPSARYAPLRQLWPRYWLPAVGDGRDGGSTYGASTSGVDILGRHEWSVSALVSPTLHETDAYANYRYAGLGVPVLDVAAQQEWDGTFRAVNDSGATIGLIARRRRYLTLATTWAVPRVRWSLTGALGAQYELRDFTSDVDAALGAPNSLLRRGTRYPSLFVNGTVGTGRLGLRGISVEEGFTLSTNTSYRWRQDAPSLGSWRSVFTGRGYVPLSLPGFARHVLATRVAVGVADSKTQTEFSVGGTSGVMAEVVPGINVGDPGRTFPVRGVAPGVQRGIRALGASVEYRAPLRMFERVPSPFTLYADRLSMVLFSDAARAWCPASLAATNTPVCERPGERDGIVASVGAELVLDVAVQYDIPFRARLGYAAPFAGPAGVSRKGGVFVSLGGLF